MSTFFTKPVDDVFTVDNVSNYSEKEKKLTLTMKRTNPEKDMKNRYLYLMDNDQTNIAVGAKEFLEHLKNEYEDCKTEETCLEKLKVLYNTQNHNEGDFRTAPLGTHSTVNRRLAGGLSWTTDMLELKGMEVLDFRPLL